MSDAPQGENWWQASDGHWYAPEQHPQATAQTPAAEPVAQTPVGATGSSSPQTPAPGMPPPYMPAPDEDATTAEDESSGKGKLVLVAVLVLALIAAGVGAFFVLGSDDDGGDDVAVADGPAPDIGDATKDLVDDGPIEFNTEYRAALEGERTEARYTLDAPAGAMMTVRVSNTAPSQRPVFADFQSAGDQFAGFRVQPGADESEVVILDEAGDAGFDLIFTEGPAEFTFEVALEVQNDAGQGGDAGAEFSSAFEVGAGSEVAGLLGGEDSTDHYTVELEAGSELSLDASVERESERAVLFTLQLNGDQLFSERVQPGGSTSMELLLADTDEGTLEVIATEGAADYLFTVEFDEGSEGGEAGDAPGELANARSVTLTSPITGKVGGRDEGDLFTFDAPAASITITASADASSERAYSVTIQDASGSQVAFFRVPPGSEASETVEVAAGSQVRLLVGEGPAAYSITVA